ncbi:MerR family DNA-binding transcriptional regulator [Psychrobacter sp. ASPA161_9]|uniref:MerR family DNA-binding transcriptional regulator n=1 Tax=Psychrobacter sp. ASPA161_9 TaxID=3160961 RepID=UPI003F801CB2
MSRTISKLAKEIGINIETVRFYERKGLIKQPIKPMQGYRQYPIELTPYLGTYNTLVS